MSDPEAGLENGLPARAWGALRGAIAPQRCPRMHVTHDQTLARAPQVGALVHEAIGLIAATTLSPAPSRILEVAGSFVGRFPAMEGRAHRQNIAAGASSYFSHLLPPACWLFHGTEVHLGHGRLDLVWTDFDDRILVDEVKSGGSRSLRLAQTRGQVEAYRACAVDTWGDRFVGVRMLSTADPHASVLVTAGGAIEPLFETAFVRGA